MSSQQFNGQVEQVAAGDIKNFIEAPHVEQRFISSAQRQALNTLVAELAQEHEVEARVLWREVVHASVGVESIGEIPRDSFKVAEGALYSWRDQRREQANIKQMLERILSATTEKGIETERDSWCLRQFGERYLNSMTKDQLRQVLVFVEDFQTSQSEQSAPLFSEAAGFRKRGFYIDIKSFVTTYPVHCSAVVLVLFFLGKIS